jgi:NSS family neurotransmitter:Na+ symporter
MAKKKEFGSKIGLIAATVGSAVGLGNVWRFPSEVQANGGAAFLLVYIGCVFVLGISVMLAEFSLGRAGGSDAVGSFRNLGAKRPWWFVGGGGVLASYLILCFYMVVAGWTLEYLLQSITGDLYSSNAVPAGMETTAAYDIQFGEKMKQYIQGDWAPLVNTYIMIGINLVVLLCGVRKGIERLSNVLMPLLFILLIIFCCEALSLPKAKEGLEFFFHPDFSKITPSVIVNALGQSFFSLSLGMGILITYSSYFPKDTKLTRTAITVSLLDLLVAILMGVIIFPTVLSYGLADHNLAGGTLVFVTLPEVFAHMPCTQLWSILFFLLLMVAALTSTISIAEVSVAFVQDRFNKSRLTACLIVLLPLFVLSAICSLSNGSLSHITIFGNNIFDALDYFATNMLLPIVSIFTCIYIGWFAPKGLLKSQLTNDGELKSRILPIVLFIIRYIAPLLIFFILISKII